MDSIRKNTMQHRYKKKPSIEVKTLLVIVKKGRILVSKGRDNSFIRPPGGHVEFYETSERAVRREIKEEINSGVVNLKFEGVLENAFYFNLIKSRRHDINFIYSGDLTNTGIYGRDYINGREGRMLKRFYWISLTDITKYKMRLVPEGVFEIAQRLNK